MDYTESKIVLVDDQEEHLRLLCSSFFREGIPCIPILYDEFAELPSLKSIRLLFLDIKLTQAGSDVQMFTVLAEYLGRIIGPNNGPYALIFWTDRRGIISQLKDHIQRRHDRIPSPFLIECIDKDQIIGNGNPEHALRERLSTILSTNSIRLLFDLKNAVAYSCDSVIDSLYSKIKSPDLLWGEMGNFEQDINRTFSKIAATHYGLIPARQNPQKALFSALSPLMEHRFINISSELDYQGILTELYDKNSIKNIDYPPHFSQYSLNTTFHVDVIDNADVNEKKKRGCVVAYGKSKRAKSNYCTNKLGITYLKLFERCFPYQKPDAVTKSEAKKKYQDAFDSSRLIFIEISAACDYAQDKKRINPYIVGIMVPLPDMDIFNSNMIPDSIMELPIILLEEQAYKINICSNYVIGLLPTDSILGKPLFILKHDLVNFISNHYTNHLSRIGISEFK
ncbi:hypothetical protein [Butyricimonas faecihominis]